jgi:BTB/POZ domain
LITYNGVPQSEFRLRGLGDDTKRVDAKEPCHSPYTLSILVISFPFRSTLNSPPQSPVLELPLPPASTGNRMALCFLFLFVVGQESYRTFSDTVQVVAGDGQPFMVHRAFAVKAPFFDSCLRYSMREGRENIVGLPEEDPKVVEDFIGFLYLGRVTLEIYFTGIAETVANHDHLGPRDPNLEAIMRLYQLLETYNFEELQNLLMDGFTALARVDYIDAHFLRIMDAEFRIDCPFVRFWSADTAYNLNICGFCGTEDKDRMLNWVADGGELVKKIFGMMVERGLENPQEKDKYEWHVHEYTPKCSGENGGEEAGK